MKKTNILKKAITAAFFMAGTGIGVGAIAQNQDADDLGDSRIHSPLPGITLTTEPAVDVWFIAATDADFYSIDLRAYNDVALAPHNTLTKGCGHPDPHNSTHIKKMIRADDSAIQCGLEIVGTAPVNGKYDKSDGDITIDTDPLGEADMHLCKWRTPDLQNGYYQIAVNSIKLGAHSKTENRYNCKNNVGNILGGVPLLNGLSPTRPLVPTITYDLLALTPTSIANQLAYNLGNPDPSGLVDIRLSKAPNSINLHRDPTYSFNGDRALAIPIPLPIPMTMRPQYGVGNVALLNDVLISPFVNKFTGNHQSENGDNNYQTFRVNYEATAAITQKPNRPTLVTPQNGTPVGGGVNGNGTGANNNDTNLIFTDLSPVYGKANWYELWITPKGNTHDSARIHDFDSNLQYDDWFKVIVDSSELTCTDNPGIGRTCDIQLHSPTIAAAYNDDYFDWWVRGYNDEKGDGPWSNKGTFTGSRLHN